MLDVSTDLSAPALKRAIEDQFVGFWRRLGRSSRLLLAEQPDLVRWTADIPFPMLNGVVSRGNGPALADGRIAETLDFFRERGLPMMWWTGLSGAPGPIDGRLRAHGLRPRESLVGMAADLGRLPAGPLTSERLRIERVDGERTLAAWLEPFAAGFDIPDIVRPLFAELIAGGSYAADAPTRHYVGSLDGVPVACSSLILGDGVAGIYNVATSPDARRRGIGGEMTRRPLLDAREVGFRIGVLHASDEGVNVYRRLGFRDYGTLRLYVWEGREDERR